MTEINKGNKLIAEFMGGKPDEDAPNHWIEGVQGLPFNKHGRFHVEQGEYHSSWDWLMPVVKKIQDELGVNPIYLSTDISRVWKQTVEYIKTRTSLMSNKPKEET